MGDAPEPSTSNGDSIRLTNSSPNGKDGATMNDHVVSITFTIIGGRDEPDAVVLVMASGRKVTYRR